MLTSKWFWFSHTLSPIYLSIAGGLLWLGLLEVFRVLTLYYPKDVLRIRKMHVDPRNWHTWSHEVPISIIILSTSWLIILTFITNRNYYLETSSTLLSSLDISYSSSTSNPDVLLFVDFLYVFFRRDDPPKIKEMDGGCELKVVEIGVVVSWWTIDWVALEDAIVNGYAMEMIL